MVACEELVQFWNDYLAVSSVPDASQNGLQVQGKERVNTVVFGVSATLELFEKAHERKINTVIDTSAQPFTRGGEFFYKFKLLMGVTDLILLDIKQINPDKHKILTGWEYSAGYFLGRMLLGECAHD